MSLENQARTYAMEKAGWDERSVCHPQAKVIAPDFQAQENKPRILFLLGNAKEKNMNSKLKLKLKLKKIPRYLGMTV